MRIREPHLKRYKRQLRDALLNPALSSAQRDEIKDQLRVAGQPRQYPAPVKPAPSRVPAPTPVVEPAATEAPQQIDDLLVLLKDDLLALAATEGVGPFSSKATKNEIAQAILDGRKSA